MYTSLIIPLYLNLNIIQFLLIILIITIIVIKIKLIDHLVLSFSAQFIGNDGRLKLNHGIEMHFLFWFA